MLFIAIDFDGTIVEDRYPKIGQLKEDAKQVINILASQGHKILIWTCRQGQEEIEAKQFLISEGIHFDCFNENHPYMKNKYTNDTRKIGADIYIDDKNIFNSEMNWMKIYQYIDGRVR